MAEKTEFLQAIDDAILDADSLEKFINGSEDETVLTRLNAEYPSIKKALKELFAGGGISARYNTLTELNNSNHEVGGYALVTDDSTNINGIYTKTVGGWVKSKYDAWAQTKDLTDDLVLRILGENERLELDSAHFRNKGRVLSNGVLRHDANDIWSYTNFIRVFAGSEIVLSTVITDNRYVALAYYDTDKQFIKSFTAPESSDGLQTVTISAEKDGYIVAQHAPTSLSHQCKVVIDDKLHDFLLTRDSFGGSDLIAPHNIKGFKKGGNLFNRFTVNEHGFVDNSNGRIISNAEYPYTIASDFIPVKPNTPYTVTHNDLTALGAEYDADKNYISGFNGRYSKTIDTSSNAAFLRLNINKNEVDLKDFVIKEGGDDAPVARDYYGWVDDRILQVSGGASAKRFLDKKLLVTGDSITQNNFHTDRPWHKVAQETLGLLQVQNDAKSGAGLVKNGGTNYRLPNWETRFDTPDFVLNMANMNDGTTTEPTNDWNWIYGGEGDPHKGDWDTVITAENMPDSLWYAVRYCCEQIIEKYPNAPFGWITSQPRAMVATKSGNPREGYSDKCWGRDGWFSEWVDVIKEICGHYSIPVLDLYHESSLRPWLPENNSYYFSNEDKIHPNTLGHQVLANRIIPFIEQYM